MYWITRFGCLNTVSIIFMIIGMVACFVLLLCFYISNGQAIYDESHGYNHDSEEYKKYRDTCIKSLRIFIPMTIISILAFVFIPTTKEALAIYGVGGTIDYIKQNPTAKQIPDKCINALDKWVDSWTIEKIDSIKDNKE